MHKATADPIPPPALSQILQVLQSEPRLDRAILFGSRALGRHNNGSDIDIACSGAGLSLEIMNRLRTQLDDLPIPYCVDLIHRESIQNQDLHDHIHRVGVVLYERPSPDEN